MRRAERAATIAAAALAATGTAAQPLGETVRVPVAAPSFTVLYEGEAEPEWREPAIPPANEILLRNFPTTPPADVQSAVEALRVALPKDWLAGFMRSFGYVPSRRGAVARTRRSDLRQLDLARFLFARWVDVDLDTRLAREFTCMSTGEFSISVFLTLLTEQEQAMSEESGPGWRPGPDRARWRLAYTAQSNARAAWWRCKQLVERGWTPTR